MQFAFPVPAHMPAQQRGRTDGPGQRQPADSQFSNVLRGASGDEASQNENQDADSSAGQTQSQNAIQTASSTAPPTSQAAVDASALVCLPGFQNLAQRFPALEGLQNPASGEHASGALKNPSASAPMPANGAKESQKTAVLKDNISVLIARNLPLLSDSQPLNDTPIASANRTFASSRAVTASNANSPEQSESGSPVNAAGAATSSDPIAFNMAVTRNESSEDAPESSAGASGGPVPITATIAAPAAMSAEPSRAREGDPVSNTLNPAATQAEIARDSEPRPRETEQAHCTETPNDESPLESRNELVRNVHVDLQTDDNQRVNLRFTTAGPELHVSVRSADANLTETLRAHIPELTSRLEQQHFRAEVWVPRSQEASQTSSRNPKSFDSPGGHAGAQGNPGRQNGRHSDVPDSAGEDVPAETTFKETTQQLWLQ